MENPWMTLPIMATVPVLGPPTLPAPGEPGPFSLSSTDVVHDVLRSAGWSGVHIETLAIDQPHPAGDAVSVARVVLELNPPIAQAVRRMPDRVDETVAAITGALRPLERDGVVHFDATALIVTAQG
jgi:hypothetical protein